MTPRPWLPANMPMPAEVQLAFAQVIEAWSDRWFARVTMTLAPFEHAEMSNVDWRGLSEGVFIGLRPNSALEIGANVLDVPTGGRRDCDRELLEDVAESCLADLQARLAQLVEAQRSMEWHPALPRSGWTAMIGGTAGALAIAIAEPLFAALVRRKLPAGLQTPLGSAIEALAAASVTVGAAIGRATLTVGDLEALAVGDVVVLDRHLADPLPIAVDGSTLARGQARVIAAKPQPFLEIVSPAA